MPTTTTTPSNDKQQQQKYSPRTQSSDRYRPSEPIANTKLAPKSTQFVNNNSPGMSPTNSPAEQMMSSKTRTVETVTYKVEKDGVIETKVEQILTIQSDGG